MYGDDVLLDCTISSEKIDCTFEKYREKNYDVAILRKVENSIENLYETCLGYHDMKPEKVDKINDKFTCLPKS